MADSITLFVPIAPMDGKDFVACNFAYQAMQRLSHRASGDPFPSWVTAKSPLTGASYKIFSVISADRQRLKGYLISVNIPACAVGHNYLLVNGVPFAAKLAYRLLVYWLLTEGGTEKAVRALQFEKAQVNSITLTYLLMCDNLSDSHAARREFASHSEAIQNKKSKGKAPAFSVGAAEKATSYIKTRQYTISAYVKDGPVEEAFVDFPTLNDEAVIRTEAEFYLRIEVQLHGSWLSAHGLDTVERWVLRIGAKNPYEKGFQLIRKEMRLNENLRQRAPKEQTIAEMREPDQSYLRWHLKGGDVRRHPSVLAKGTLHEQNAYFSAIKLRLLNKVKTDISLKWERQSKDLSPRLNELIKYTGEYEPEIHLGEKIYSRVTAPKCIEKLDALIAELISKR